MHGILNLEVAYDCVNALLRWSPCCTFRHVILPVSNLGLSEHKESVLVIQPGIQPSYRRVGSDPHLEILWILIIEPIFHPKPKGRCWYYLLSVQQEDAVICNITTVSRTSAGSSRLFTAADHSTTVGLNRAGRVVVSQDGRGWVSLAVIVPGDAIDRAALSGAAAYTNWRA